MCFTSADFDLKTDATKSYVDWAVKKGFEVIDVNIPHVATAEDNGEYTDADSFQARAKLTRDIATYIWQNYVE
jgi:histone deacetylase 6